MNTFVQLLFFVAIVLGLSYGSAYASITSLLRVGMLHVSPKWLRPYLLSFLYCPTCQAFWYGALVGRFYDPMHFVNDSQSAWLGTGAYACVAMAAAYGFFRNNAHPSAEQELELLEVLRGGARGVVTGTAKPSRNYDDLLDKSLSAIEDVNDDSSQKST